MDSTFADLQKKSLVWLPEHGIGFHPAEGFDYGEDYWAEYVRRAATPVGKALTKARVDFVAKFMKGDLVDVGVGAGAFVEARNAQKKGSTWGFDINPRAVAWLGERGWLVDPWQGCASASFWDSLEHLADPAALLARVRKWVFVSLPIFRDAQHVLASKHFKPGEHVWYFTHDGFVRWMASQGWVCAGTSEVESELGREDIETFAFYRRGA